MMKSVGLQKIRQSAVPPKQNYSTSAKEVIILLSILVFATLHGLIYVFIVPPWQHYDEPNHFEYLWLVANWDGLPQAGDYDAELSRKVVTSMLAYGFYDQMGEIPELGSAGQEVKIPGYSQLAEPPLYYLIASMPMRLLPTAPVELLLYAARLVSLAFYLITLILAWGVARELTSAGHPLRWMLPLTIAMLPSFTDLMTATNSDAGAVLFFSLFIWGSVRLIQRGFTILGFLWVCLTAGLTYFIKNTAMVAILLLPVVVVFSVVRGRWRWLAWGILFVGTLAVLMAVISWDDAAYWYRSTSQSNPLRIADVRAVHGEYIFMLETLAEVTPAWLIPAFQPLPTKTGQDLSGQVVTLGFWIWATQPIKASSPALGVPGQLFSETIEVDTVPGFYAFQIQLPVDTSRLWIELSSRFARDFDARVYYDGLVLAIGKRPIDEPPHFAALDGSQGEWGGQPFTNLLRNGSAEIAGPRVINRVDSLGARLLADNMRPSLILSSILDWQAAGFLVLASLKRIFYTFWAWFGWAHIPLFDNRIYLFLRFATMFGLVGAMIGALQRWRRLPYDVLIFLGLTLCITWLSALTRGMAYLVIPRPYLPVARYIYPAIIPAMLVLNYGWLQLINLAGSLWGRLSRPMMNADVEATSHNALFLRRILFAVFIVSFAVLDFISLVSIARYYGKL